jgi:hypothetical protein
MNALQLVRGFGTHRATAFLLVAAGSLVLLGAVGPVLGLLYASLLGVVAVVAVDRKVTTLRRLLAEADQRPWTVRVNTIVVSAIGHSDYAALQLSVFEDPRVYLHQALLVLGAGARFILSFAMQTLPLVVFWAAVGAFIWAPREAVDALRALAETGVDGRLAAVLGGLYMAAMLATPAIGAVAVFRPSVLGVTNAFDRAIALRIRQHLGCAVDGTITVERCANQSLA